MKSCLKLVILALALSGASAWSQQSTTAAPKPGFGDRHFRMHGPGKWWRDADTVKQIGLSDSQAQQIEQSFTEHRMRLIDWVADVQKQELKLETYMNADQPDEAQISNQVDQVVAARGKLEKEHSLMMLDIRRVLNPEQWKKLQSIRGDMAAGGVFFHRFTGPGPGGPGHFNIPVPPPQPPASQPE